MDKLLKILSFLKPFISGLSTILGWLFFRHLKQAFQKVKAFLIRISSFFIFLRVKFKPLLKNELFRAYMIAIPVTGLLAWGIILIKIPHGLPQIPTSTTYNISSSSTITHVAAESDGTISEINGKITFFIDNPDKTVSFLKNEPFVSFDSSDIDSQLKDLRQTSYSLSGSKTVISQETIDSPDEVDLNNLKAQINSLKIQEDQQKVDLINLESQYYQAKNLYDQRVVTQSYLDEITFKYAHAKRDLDIIDSNINSLQDIYRQKSVATKHNTITITTRGTPEEAYQANLWLENTKKKIDELNNQKSKMSINSPFNCILKSVYVRMGQKVKKGTVILDVIDSNNLTGVVQLTKEDLKLIKEEKAKIYFVNQNTSVRLEIQRYELAENKLSFKLQGDKMINHYKEANIIIERK